MSRGPRSRGDDWRPTASWRNLRRRAALLAGIRGFFAERGVLEVETPLLSSATVTDPHLASLKTELGGRTLYLQTSPEFAMKRLLAAGSGPIYQITKAFRGGGEVGRRHNPEFTLLEWYRPGFDHHALMDEMDELLGRLLGVPAAERLTYGELFERTFGLDPHRAGVDRLRRAAAGQGLDAELGEACRDDWLDLLLGCVIEPRLGRGRPTFVHDYPVSQAALARVRPGDLPGSGPPLAERFEVYVEGVELANGFHELADAAEQRRRFAADLERRSGAGLDAVPIDERFLAALAAGLPDCAGVALGVDRLAMVAAGGRSLRQVMAMPIERA